MPLQGIFLNLALLYNKGLMKHLYLASADNLSDEQQREKYDAIVVSGCASSCKAAHLGV